MRAGALDRLDLAISRVALGKDAATQRPLESRLALRRTARPSRGRGSASIVTDAQLITDIAAGYDVVVMGADKWAQVRDPAWYDGSAAARDAALAAPLPRARRAAARLRGRRRATCSSSPNTSARCRRRPRARASTT